MSRDFRLRGLRLRVFALTTLVALAAVGATAWLTLWQTSVQVSDTGTAYDKLLRTVGPQLEDYARLHGTWEGVAETAQSIAARTGKRIRLLDSSDWTIVDTAAGAPATSVGPPMTLDVRPSPNFIGSATPDQVWEAALGYRRSVLLAACLTRKELPIMSQDGTPADRQAREECVNASVVMPAAAEKARLDACGGDTVCMVKVFDTLVDDVAPPTLRLYVDGPPGRVHVSRRPELITAATVALVTVLITVLLSQRVLRPIGTLTRAAHGLAGGDLSARVPVRGRDELADLARSFNRMADSLQSSENRQRQMIADIAHELRTPLSNLRGYLEALRDGVLAPDRELFASLHEEALLQQRIVDDLQDLALAETGAMVYQWGPLDVLELLRTCVTAHQAAGESAGVAVRLAAADPPGPLVVRADTDRLRQVLGNLVTNALRATPSDGAVTLAATREPDGMVGITVTDTGTGMSAEELNHVFERFWRADSARARGTGGSGLGLAIAREIITAHDGAIDITSTAGEGTVVTVRLPASRPSGPGDPQGIDE